MRYPFEREWPVTQEFGENAGDYARFGMLAHNGIDFGCPMGTPVLAAGAGTVEKAEFDDGGYGWYVQIKHSGGMTSVYGHLSQCRVGALASVVEGQLVGMSGSSGNSTGPHLHFEVRQAGLERNGYWGAVDPRPLIEWPGKPAPVPVPVPPGVPAETYRVRVTALNVRSGPGVGSQVLGQLHAGDEVMVESVAVREAWGRLADGRWIALMFEGSELAAKK